ncbi:hypothetical protein ANANG_G00292400 [Anguilla anguilla]|uniref:Voltage-dependent T-type calcium channel subunit alpha-1G n=1 Tax=Anguilla anguilla TaxID=7936 RepID=A0A9D3RLY6_ANGAN|nr:hypothetical protein ANANG_G00292400 [Anguilla anguilla]
MTTEEGPGVPGAAQVGAGLCEDYGPAPGEEAMEEAGLGDDVSSDLGALVVPFPELAPVVFFCLKQTTCPRSWCIRMVSSPYPLAPRNAEPIHKARITARVLRVRASPTPGDESRYQAHSTLPAATGPPSGSPSDWTQTANACGDGEALRPCRHTAACWDRDLRRPR